MDCDDMKEEGCADLKEVQDDPYSDSYSDSSDSSDPSDHEYTGKVKDLALTLKDDSKFVDLSFNILKYLKDGDHDDIKSFSEMVNQVLSNERFLNELYDYCQKHSLFRDEVNTYGRQTQSHKEIVDKLSRIKNDPFFEEDEKLARNDSFLEEVVEGGDPEIVVRGALSVLLSYCIIEDYIKNMGVWLDPYSDSDDCYDSKSDDSNSDDSKSDDSDDDVS